MFTLKSNPFKSLFWIQIDVYSCKGFSFILIGEKGMNSFVIFSPDICEQYLTMFIITAIICVIFFFIVEIFFVL